MKTALIAFVLGLFAVSHVASANQSTAPKTLKVAKKGSKKKAAPAAEPKKDEAAAPAPAADPAAPTAPTGN